LGTPSLSIGMAKIDGAVELQSGLNTLVYNSDATLRRSLVLVAEKRGQARAGAAKARTIQESRLSAVHSPRQGPRKGIGGLKPAADENRSH
jgi:hypothetical protein